MGGLAEQHDGVNEGAQEGLQPAGICGSDGIGGGRMPRQQASLQAGAQSTGHGGGHSLGSGLRTPGGISELSPAKQCLCCN